MALQLTGAAIPPGDRQCIDPAVGSRAHIGGGIAHQQSIGGKHAGAGQDLGNNLRRRLQRPAGPIAENGHERNSREKTPDQILRPLLEFIGSDGQLYAACMQLREQLRHARIRLRMHINMRLIISDKIGQRSIDIRICERQVFGRWAGSCVEGQ